MGLFGNLFGRKDENNEASKGYSIDICDNYFVINGQELDMPIHINALTAVLGKPRAQRFKTDAESQQILESLHSEPVSKRVNYTWDDLGLMCYTYNGKVVNTFGICIQPQTNDSPSNPKSLYKGKISINGGPWLPVIMAGEDCDFFREAQVGSSYLITAEYKDFEQDDITRNENGFTGLEIQLK